MRVFLNFTASRGPDGGANAFLRTLVAGLERHGVEVTNDPDAKVDVALLNALTDGIRADFAAWLAERGVPIVHRKVGYRVSGSPQMRALDADGVVRGDRLQLEFSPFIKHTIFQSDYSREVFESSGFDGASTVIRNGVDERVFNQLVGPRSLGRRRSPWDGASPIRVVVSTISNDPNKGFDEYARIDRSLSGRRDVTVSLVGRVPAGMRFANISVEGPYRRERLSRTLKSRHVLLQLARWETCSNALIEGINCGLPAIYVDLGSNGELAAEYGVAYEDDFFVALDRVRERYAELFERTADNPYRSALVVPKYLALLREVAEAG